MSTAELIKICEDLVVHHTLWSDRDSYAIQAMIKSIYLGLTAGLNYRIVTKEISDSYYTNDNTIVIEFLKPINTLDLLKGHELVISSKEDYHIDCDPEYKTEMFEGNGIDFNSNYTIGYLPIRELL